VLLLVSPQASGRVEEEPLRFTLAAPKANILPPMPWRRSAGVAPRRRRSSDPDPLRYLHCEDLLSSAAQGAAAAHPRTAGDAIGRGLASASARYRVGGNDLLACRWGECAPAELLLVESLRQYVASLPPARTGWLRAPRSDRGTRPDGAARVACREFGRWSASRAGWRCRAASSATGRRRPGPAADAIPGPVASATRRALVADHRRDQPEIAGRVGYESTRPSAGRSKRGLGEPPATWRASRAEPRQFVSRCLAHGRGRRGRASLHRERRATRSASRWDLPLAADPQRLVGSDVRDADHEHEVMAAATDQHCTTARPPARVSGICHGFACLRTRGLTATTTVNPVPTRRGSSTAISPRIAPL